MIATGFESGGAYRPERSTSYTATYPAAAVPEERGAKIPPFLLNRQSRSD